MLNIYHSAADAPETLPPNSLVNDYFEAAILKIADGSVDAVIIDPPYTDGQTDALPNHKIQTKIDINRIVKEVQRILKPNGFFVFFGQMPTVLAWLNAAQSTFKYREHITWCKRNITSPYLAIQRSKEDIFIYAKGKPAYFETQERYEDLKLPAVPMGLYDLQTIHTILSDLQRRVKDNAYNMLYFQGISVGNSHLDNSLATLPAPTGQTEEDFADKTFEELDKLQAVNWDKNAMKNDNQIGALYGMQNAEDFDELEKNQREVRPLSNFRNDGLMQHAFQKTLENRAAQDFENLDKNQTAVFGTRVTNDEWLGKKLNATDLAREKAQNNTGKIAHRYRSKHYCNLTNTWYFFPEPADRAVSEICTVWSYLSQNQTKMGKDGENWKHPTVKPLKLLKRLIKLLCPDPEKTGLRPLVVDFFLGSGTTAVAAAELKVDFIGVELQPDYFAMSCARTEAALDGRALNSSEVATAASPAPRKINQLDLF